MKYLFPALLKVLIFLGRIVSTIMTTVWLIIFIVLKFIWTFSYTETKAYFKDYIFEYSDTKYFTITRFVTYTYPSVYHYIWKTGSVKTNYSNSSEDIVW